MSKLGHYISNVTPTGSEGYISEDPTALRSQIIASAWQEFNRHFAYHVPQHYDWSNIIIQSNLLSLYFLHHYSADSAPYISKVRSTFRAYKPSVTLKSKEQFTADLIDQVLEVISGTPHSIPEHQLKRAFHIVELLSEQKYDQIEQDIVIQYSVENEVLFIRTGAKGNHYIFVGDDVDDLSYGFVGFVKGVSHSVHADFDVTGILDIVNEFVNG